MKFKFNCRKNGINFECEVDSMDEVDKNIQSVFSYIDYIAENVHADIKDSKQTLNEDKPVELASEAQKNYMKKLRISFNENITKIEAIDLINKYKEEHNIPVGGSRGPRIIG